MTEERCACGHPHEPESRRTPAELAALHRKKQQLAGLQEDMRRIQGLHDKIDKALARVDRANTGSILMQKKTLKALKRLAEEVLGKGREPFLAALYAAEQEYIRNVEDIMHHAQILKRAGQGSVTPEVLANMEKSLKAAEK